MENQQPPSSPPPPSTSPPETKRLGKRKVAMHIGYEGTLYRGLQSLKSREFTDTIEDALESALFASGGILENNRGSLDKIAWSRSSRTDKRVHSLATVVTFKLECCAEGFEDDPNGIMLARDINAHLPPSIRVFSVQKVTKGFNARPECLRRSYDYFLPVSVLGKDVQSEEFKERFELLKKAWSLFEGYRAFHNYTKRKLYRYQGKQPTNMSSRDEDASDDDDEQREGRDEGSLLHAKKHTSTVDDMTVVPTGATHTTIVDNSATTDGNAEKATAARDGGGDDDDDASMVMERTYTLKLEWKAVKDDKDPVTRRHYRYIEACRLTDQSITTLVPGGEPCIRMNIKGASFMLHQIRHMVGCAVAVALGVIPLELVEPSLSTPLRMSMPLAPPSTLVLTDTEFSPFRTSWNGQKADVCQWTGDKLTLREPGQDLQREFAAACLFPALNELLKNDEWAGWVDILRRLRYEKEEISNIVELFDEWRAERLAAKEARQKEAAAVSDEEEAMAE